LKKLFCGIFLSEMLKAVILCIVLKANEVLLDEPLRTNISAESNTSSIVNSIGDSSVSGSVKVSNSSSSQISGEIVNANGSSAGNKTSENEQLLGNGMVMNNNIIDNFNLLDNIADLTPGGEEEETVLAALNETERSRNISINEVNMTSYLSSADESLTQTESFTRAPSPTEVITPMNNPIPTSEPTSLETSNLSNSSIVYSAPTMLPIQSSQEDLYGLSLVPTSSPSAFNNTQKSTAGIIPEVNLTVVRTLTPSYAPATSFDTTREPTTQSFTPSPAVPSNMAFENTSNQSVARVEGKVESEGNKTSNFSSSTVLHITPPTIEASEPPTLSPTYRPTDLPGINHTAHPALPFNLKPAPSTASMTIESGDGVSSESSEAENGEIVGSSLAHDDAGRVSTTKTHGSGRLIIIISAFVILTITIIVSCMAITRWCWRRWSGYSQIDIGGESIELGVVRNRFLNEPANFNDESTHLKY